jgi:hypothetical protein
VHHAVFCKYYTELAKTFFFCLTLGQEVGFCLTHMAFVSVPPFFCNIVYNWMQDYLYIVMIIKQLN